MCSSICKACDGEARSLCNPGRSCNACYTLDLRFDIVLGSASLGHKFASGFVCADIAVHAYSLMSLSHVHGCTLRACSSMYVLIVQRCALRARS